MQKHRRKRVRPLLLAEVQTAPEDTASKAAAAKAAPDPSTAEVQAAAPEARPRDPHQPRGKPGRRPPARALILAAAGVVAVLGLAGVVVVNSRSAGRWRLWPCYELGDGTTCPDEWQAFPVVVG
jgi:hypothetical protein